MSDPITYFITWTTYGAWMPGDERGWRKANKGEQAPQPLLADWCRNRMTEATVILNDNQQEKVERVIQKHALIRG